MLLARLGSEGNCVHEGQPGLIGPLFTSISEVVAVQIGTACKSMLCILSSRPGKFVLLIGLIGS